MLLNRPLENGILRTFCMFTGVRLMFSLVGVLTQIFGLAWERVDIILLMVYSILDPALLIVYLSFPRLQRILKGFYLPLGILWATAGPISAQHIGFMISESMVSEVAVRLVAWQLIPVLFIPLVIVGWQYSMREVVIFCLLTGGLGFVPVILLLALQVSAPLVGVFIIQMITFLMVGNMITNLMKVQRAQRAQLTGANQRLAEYASTLEALTISRERNRVARELHDVLAHTLSGVAVELEGLRAVLHNNPEKSQALLDHSLKAVREGLTETRRALQELRAKPLEDLGLSLAVRTLVESAAVRAGLALDVSIEGNFGDMPEQVQQSLYRVAQEALANITEHAQARSVRLSLARKKGSVCLEVQDDGLGFNPEQANEAYQFGLRGMRERAEMTGGNLVIESQAGAGTRIVYTVAAAPEAALPRSVFGVGGGDE